MGDEITLQKSSPPVSQLPVGVGLVVAGKSAELAQPKGKPVEVKVEPPRENAVTVSAEKMMLKMREAVAQLNKMAVNSGRGLNFEADTQLGRHVITVTNTDTGEVVRTIPTDVAIRVAHGTEDFKGLLLDHQT